MALSVSRMRPRAVFVYKLSWGLVLPGVAIYDTMQFVRPDVHTVCIGLAASMGSFILVGGEIANAQSGEFILEAAELLKLRETLTGFLCAKTGKPLWVVSKIWKEMFLCQQQKPKLMELLIL
ncbi:hypothetical protein HAX54_015775 [Datura stramonium]|uniref:ATP-dependent Clp protease proteolytic subunit n=1 Tax=Datura stramonium TaxID=4076 RepID=A0ABS8UHQ2_DATST|nr:hypothetical protein [Datura stramonium]